MGTATTQPSSTELLAHRDQIRRLVTRVGVTVRYAWVGAIIVLVIGGASVFLAMKSQRRYTSKAVVLYRQMIQASDIGTERRGGSFLDLGTQLQELLLTRPRLTAVIDEYKLYPKVVATRGYGPAVDELRQNLQIRITAGNTIHIQYTADSAKIAQSVVAWLTSSLIEEESRLRTEQADVTVKFLEGERKRAVEDLHNKEETLARFLAKHPEFVAETSGGGGSLLAAGGDSGGGAMGTSLRPRSAGRTAAAPRAAAPDAALLTLERQAARIRAQLSGNVTTPPPAPQRSDSEVDQVVTAAAEELQQAKRQLEQRQAQFTDIHPDVKAARQRVADAQARLQRLKAMRRSVATPVAPANQVVDKEALNSALAKLNRQIEARRRSTGSQGETQKAADAVVSLEVDWTRLNREVSEARSRLLSLEARQFRASLAASSEQSGQASQMQVIDPAFLPTHPSGKGRTTMVMMGVAAAVFLAALVMLALAFLDDRIYDRTDIQRLQRAPLLIVIPRKGIKRYKSTAASFKRGQQQAARRA